MEKLREYVSLDLEMTGLNTTSDQIIEIGAVIVKGDEVEQLQSLLRTDHPLSDKITEITGITNEMLKDAPLAEDVLPDFIRRTEGLPLLGHRISMDYAFMKQWAVNHKMSYERLGLDTLKLSRRIRPDLVDHKLLTMLEAYGIDPGQHHRALDDAIATADLLDCLYQDLPKAGITDEEAERLFRPQILQHRAKKQTPATPAQMRYLKRFCAYHGIELPQDAMLWNRSQMSRETDRMVEKYGKIPKTEL